MWESAGTGEVGKYIYDAARDSYQIWLDSPGTVEETDVLESIITVESNNNLNQAALTISKMPSEVEFDGERYGVHDWYATAKQILDEPIADGLFENTLADIPKRRYRVTMEVEAYDITQVMSEVYRGYNALIQEVSSGVPD